jgi:hypothetical protein
MHADSASSRWSHLASVLAGSMFRAAALGWWSGVRVLSSSLGRAAMFRARL